MAEKTQQSNKSNKRKQITGPHIKSGTSPSKKPKLLQSNPSNPPNKKLFKSAQKQCPVRSYPGKVETAGANGEPKSKRESRLHAKELAEARKKKKGKKHYTLEQNGRQVVLQLLHPNSSCYFSPEDLVSFNLSIPSLNSKSESKLNLELIQEAKSSQAKESGDKEAESHLEATKTEPNENSSPIESHHLPEGGKKDPHVRRRELLVDSGLVEVATGGAGGILHPTLDEKLDVLHGAIASLAAQPKSEESEEEHVLENFHSSRTIEKLVLDCPLLLPLSGR